MRAYAVRYTYYTTPTKQIRKLHDEHVYNNHDRVDRCCIMRLGDHELDECIIESLLKTKHTNMGYEVFLTDIHPI
jgi:hypothetical protein